LDIEGTRDTGTAEVEETPADIVRFKDSSCYSIRLMGVDGETRVALIYDVEAPKRCRVRNQSGEVSPVPETRAAERPWDAPLRDLFAVVT